MDPTTARRRSKHQEIAAAWIARKADQTWLPNPKTCLRARRATEIPQLNAGASGTVQVTLKAGTYTIWCAVDAHKARGMQGTLTVT